MDAAAITTAKETDDSSIALPRLRIDATIHSFDAGPDSSNYLVSLGQRHFVVGKEMAELLLATRDATSLEELSEQLAGRIARAVSVDEVRAILFHPSTRPLLFDGEQRRSDDPLRIRCEIFSNKALSPALAVLSRLFTPHCAIALALAFVTVDLWIAFFMPSVGASPLFGPPLLLSAMGILVGMGIHELGHLAACHRYKGRYGGIGVGLYWIFPTFYADVRNAWTLSREQRAVVDIGGAYFQCIYLLLIGCLQIVIPSTVFLSILAVSHLLLLHTLNPVLKFDGYWLLSDLTGTFNLHDRIRDTARRLWCWLTQSTSLHRFPTGAELAQLSAFLLLSSAFFSYTFFALTRAITALSASVIDRIQTHQWTVKAIATTSLTVACLCALTLALIMLVQKLIGGALNAVKKKRTEP